MTYIKRRPLLEMDEGPTDASRRLWFESLSSVPRLRLFCFPYAGGNSHVFRNWQGHFPYEIDLCLVHLPGRGRRIGERPFTRLKLLVETIADLIARELYPPYALYGHSMGALISFELTRELRRRHLSMPLRLFLSGRGAPSVPRRKPPIFNLPHDEFVVEMKRLNGTPPELLDDPKTRDLFLPVLRADFEMVGTYEYHPEERLSCPIVVYGGLKDQDIPVENLRAWEEHTSASCKVKMLAGGHFFIHDPGVGFVDALRNDVLSTLYGLARKV
jgi:medium-chain acyl-[acyl-carrier-protein] hydrolase